MFPLNYLQGFTRSIKNAYRNNPQFNQDRQHYPFKYRYIKPLFYLSAASYFVVIAIVATATAGYQFVPLVTTSWLDINTFWFDKFIPTSYRPQTRICGGHSFRIGDSVSTESPFSFFYTLYDFLDNREGQPLDELIYENAPFTNCSVNGFSIIQPLNGSASVEVTIACNTTTGQVIVLMGSEQDGEVNAGIRSARLNILGFQGDLSPSKPLNITEVIRVFYTGVVIITGTMFPLGTSQSLLFASLGDNYSSISISYPGSDHDLMDQSLYSVAINFENNNGTTGTYNIRFYSNGTRDNSSDFTQATALLSPTIKIFEADSKEPIDVWELINWYFMSCYWTFLYQFGDIAPTIYQQANNGGFDIINGQININGMGYPNFSAPITSLPTNNIFWNEELFEIYSDYLKNTLIPLILRLYPEFTIDLPEFLPLNDTNRAQRVPTAMYTSYQCSELVWKGWASATVSILVAVFSLWTAGYAIFLIILTKLEGDVPRLLG